MRTDNTGVLQQARQSVLAAMETGDYNYARTIVLELNEFDADAADSLRLDVWESYKVAL